jgi:hypothetical protein
MADLKRCYQCDALVGWLAPDSRCSRCTRFTPEELVVLSVVAGGAK